MANVTNQDRKRAERELLIQAFRVPKFNEKGNELRVDRQYLNKDIWLQIEDPFIFKQLFPSYLWHICNEMDEWNIFVKHTHPKLHSVEEFIEKKKEIWVKFEKDLPKLLFDCGKSRVELENMNYFAFKELLEKYKLLEVEKKDNKKNSK